MTRSRKTAGPADANEVVHGHVHGPECGHGHEHGHEHAHAHAMAGTYRREQPKLGRNDPCHCGSGRKFKKCHGAMDAS